VVKGEGLFIEQVSTTPTGMKSAPDFKDLSPAVLTDEKTGRVLGMHSVALTPAGSVYNLTIENAALQALTSLMSDTSKPDPKAYGNGQTDYSGLMKEQMDSIRKSLKMEGSSDEELFNVIMAKIGIGKDGPITNAGNSQTVTWPFGMDYKVMSAALSKDFGADLEARLTPLTAKITELEGQLSAQRKADETSQKNELLVSAGKEGKVLTLSAATLELTPVSALKEIIAGLPKSNLPTKPTMKVLAARDPKQKPSRNDSVAAINRMVSEQAPGEYQTGNN
jgi:hypothetical protein